MFIQLGMGYWVRADDVKLILDYTRYHAQKMRAEAKREGRHFSINPSTPNEANVVMKDGRVYSTPFTPEQLVADARAGLLGIVQVVVPGAGRDAEEERT